MFMLLIYLLRPTNSRNTLLWGKVAVVVLGRIFLKTSKMHSQSFSIPSKNLYILTYIAITWHILYPITPTLLVVSTTSCYRAENNARPAVKVCPKWGHDDRPNFECCVHDDRPNCEKYVKAIWNIYTNRGSQVFEAVFIWRKVISGRRVTLSFEFTQTFTFLQAFNNQLHHSSRATLPDSDFVFIFFLVFSFLVFMARALCA